MAAVGQLAGGIAHNFNNQLSAILGYADLLQGKLSEQTLREYAANIVVSTRLAAELTAQLLAFSRKGKYLCQPVDMNRLVRTTATLLQQMIDPRIEIQHHLDANNSTIMGDQAQLQNMLLNLGLNARDAMPQGGTLTFTTSEICLTPEQATAFNIEFGYYLRVSVTDSGTGMNSDTQAHLFEPFFTTKDIGKGTGLGLAAAHGTALGHNGAIRAYSREGQGSTFTIYLPLAQNVLVDRKIEAPMTPVHGKARVLIADDDAMIVSAVSEILHDLGYFVTTSADGAEAVALYRENWRNIDLVILDIVMPRLGGRDSFAAMRVINPAVKVLIISGYSMDGEASAILQDGARAFLQKPFTISELSHAIAEVLSGGENIHVPYEIKS